MEIYKECIISFVQCTVIIVHVSDMDATLIRKSLMQFAFRLCESNVRAFEMVNSLVIDAGSPVRTSNTILDPIHIEEQVRF